MKLVRLIKMCLNEIYSKVRIAKHLSGSFLVQNCLKQEDALTALRFNVILEYATRKVQENRLALKLNGTDQPLAYGDDVDLLRDDIGTVNRNTTLFDARNEVGIKVNVENSKSMLVSREQNAETCHLNRCHSTNIWEQQ
jgi:hypothetical protein